MTTLNLEAPIVAVTVFIDRGRITRRGNIHLSAGEHTLVIPNIPNTLDPESIRATGRGVGIRILGVDLVIRYVSETPDVDAKTLEKQLLDLQDKEAALNDHDTAECDRIKLLESLRDSSGARFAKTLATGKTSIDSFKPIAQYLTDELNAVYERRRAIAVQKRELAREIEAAKNRLDQAGATTSTTWHDVEVAVEATAEADIELEVVYAVSDCSWAPLYDARLVDNQVTLTYLAEVTQESGEDWPAVELSLSTARPAMRMTLPKLAPWYVDKYIPLPPPPPRAMLRSAMSVAAPAPMQPGAFTPQDAHAYSVVELPEMEFEEAVVETSGAAVTYRVARPVAIASDGTPHKTMVTTVTLAATLDYVVVPKAATEAYLRARIVNTSSLMLLPGKAQVFHGAEYVGAMRLPRTIAPNEEFETQLGIEDRIKVERELTERATTKTIVGNTQRVTIGYKLKLTNNLATQAHLVVSDQIPVSLSPDIKVKVQDIQPRPAEQTEKGLLKWEFDLAPAAKREIPFTFVLEYPRDLKITGLGSLEPAEL